MTDDQIAQACAEMEETLRGQAMTPFHEHPDCVRIAWQWLDAQKKLTRRFSGYGRPIKHLIERWAGRYVSECDVAVAAHMHPDVFGTYQGNFNLPARLIIPCLDRLDGIGQAMTQPNYLEDAEWRDREFYSGRE